MSNNIWKLPCESFVAEIQFKEKFQFFKNVWYSATKSVGDKIFDREEMNQREFYVSEMMNKDDEDDDEEE
ncbi:hypothetical protein MTR_4g045640 [Medicago truncatula]|uniref:Uncharacterized protein n=1 Tax=Medicago truncatula TaxID=3880 RepID=A0A072UJE3_MEDTR|nr:hypothetical protein MTR_4g045640 [Medicago truncatula]